MTPRVAVVTVTYGDRARLLQELLSALRAMDGADLITSIVAVDNGASHRTRALIAEDDSVITVDLGANLGSAQGFAAGIERALEEEADYIWLLDDDNRPEQGALVALVGAAAAAGGEIALQSLRPSYSRLSRFAASRGRIPVHEPPDTFGAQLRRVLGRLGIPTRRRESLRLPFATYGGFFASRDAFKQAGLPRPDFVSYADDTEYTHRFHRNGIPIYLVPESVVTDVDRAWWLSAPSGALGPSSLVTAEADPARMYYTIRNSVFFESTQRVTNHSRYRVILGAKHVAVAVSAALACVDRRSAEPWRAYRLYRRATADGLDGRLGEMP